MGVIVQFSYAQWSALFPTLAAMVNQTQAQSYFELATGIHRNDGGGPVNNSAQQSNLLNLLTAHIATMFTSAAPNPSPLVGRISNASEGSVSVQAAYSNNISEQMAWFIQTQYGAMYWTATAPFRTMRYVPNRNRGVVGPRGFGV